ncbi:MAG: prepilin-type N-terminal cleavage/methylation domain-containing protein [Polyangiaceae bacterium]|nr:prepilin-type N-terminal cleavage/methylation domain-containing protein [Polyangiaceae bacterium]
MHNISFSSARRSGLFRRGFTLIELMIAVVIIGILASIAVYGVRKYVLQSKTAEARSMITDIMGAQETYKTETFAYLNVTPDSDTYYPAQLDTSGQVAVQWGGTGCSNCLENFQTLGVSPDGPVYFRYSVVAAPSGALSAGSGITYTLPDPGRWWYVVKAASDLDGSGDGVPYTVFAASSERSEIIVSNPGN